GPRLSWTRPVDSQEDAALLQTVLKFYDQFAEQNATNAKLQREAARAYRRVGDIRRRLGQNDQADAAYRRAAELLDKLAAATPPPPADALEWAEIYAALDFRSTPGGELAKAEESLRKVLALAEGPAAGPGWRRTALTARAQAGLGQVLQRLGRAAEAEMACR